jgi:hypothetical protein
MVTGFLLMMAAQAAAWPFNPAAAELFERDPVLNSWAIASHDRNGDGWLTTYEAQTAAGAFKKLADANGDGRVTVREFEEAKRFIVARNGSAGPKVSASR